MSARLVAWIVGALALAAVLQIIAPGVVVVAVFTLAVPSAVVATFLAGRRAEDRDTAQALVTAAAALTDDRTSSQGSNGAQEDWGAALRAELASITVPRERRRFALGAALAMLGTPHRLRSGLFASGLAVAFAAGLLGFSRATVGRDGIGSVSMLVPPVMLFAIGFACSRSTRSLRFGVETGILAAFTTLVAVAVVFGVEAAHWFDVAHVSVFDGEYVDVATSWAAVRDAVHPIILLVHLLFWLPWPALGAIAGVRATRRGAPSAQSSS
jgi:hypothetical protein